MTPETQCCPNGCERPLGDCVAHINAKEQSAMDALNPNPTITVNIHGRGAVYRIETLTPGNPVEVLRIGEAVVFMEVKDIHRLQTVLAEHLEAIAKPRKPVFHSLSACHGCGCFGDDFASPHVEAFELTGELYCEDCADGAIEQWTADQSEAA